MVAIGKSCTEDKCANCEHRHLCELLNKLMSPDALKEVIEESGFGMVRVDDDSKVKFTEEGIKANYKVNMVSEAIKEFTKPGISVKDCVNPVFNNSVLCAVVSGCGILWPSSEAGQNIIYGAWEALKLMGVRPSHTVDTDDSLVKTVEDILSDDNDDYLILGSVKGSVYPYLAWRGNLSRLLSIIAPKIATVEKVLIKQAEE